MTSDWNTCVLRTVGGYCPIGEFIMPDKSCHATCVEGMVKAKVT